jgi:four helix bundle protein
MIETAAKSKVASYRDFRVWQKGMVLTKVIYAITRPFPAEEKFGLVSQMRRAAISIPSNIAEAQARKRTAEFVHFISNAEGSLAELDTQLNLCADLGFCESANAEAAFGMIGELKRMLNGLRRSLTRGS